MLERPTPRGAFLHGALVVGAFLAVSSCSWWGQNKAIVLHSADAACTVIELVTSDPALRSLCLVENELTKLLDLLSTGKAATLRVVDKDGTAKDVRVEAGATFAVRRVAPATSGAP